MYEIPITNDIFQIYGQDLFLFDTHPIKSVITYEAPISETISELQKRISDCLANPPPSLKRLWIRQVSGNIFKYYQDTTPNDIMTITETVPNITPQLFHIYTHPHIQQITIIANHAFWDGLALMNVLSAFCGRSDINVSVPTKPYDRLRKVWECKDIVCDVLPRPNQLTVVDKKPRYETVSHNMLEIKTTHKSLGVSMPSYLLSLYLTPLFERLPMSISYLKVFVPYYLHHPNRFNSHGVVPVLVFRNKLDAREIDASLKRQRPMLYGMEEILELHYCREPTVSAFVADAGKPAPLRPLPSDKYNLDNITTQLKPDIVFSIIKSTNETGYAKLKQMSVLYNTRDMGIYVACIQTGDEMTMSSSLFCKELL